MSAEIDEIQQLLDGRSRAVNARDEQSFMQTVDPEPPDLVDRQRSWIRRASSIPLADYSLELDLRDVGELSRGRQRRTFHVVERYRLEGYDLDPAVNDLFLSFVKKGSSWYLASDKDTVDLGLLSSRALWEFGETRMKSSAHFLVLYHPPDEQRAQGVLDQAESALEVANRVWSLEWHKKVAILIPSDRKELKELIGATFDVSNFVAFASHGLEPEAADGWEPRGIRIIINPENFARYDAEGKRRILAHELVHVATRTQSGPFIPAFVDEGLAELTLESSSGIAGLRRGFDSELPDDWEFSAGSSNDISTSYREATAAALYIKQRWGLEKLLTFYQAIGRRQLEPGTDQYHLNESMKEVFGIGLDQFESEWIEFVRSGPR